MPALVVLVVVWTCGGPASAGVVGLADSSLGAVVQADLGEADPSTLSQLVARSAGITDLTGIEQLTGLTTLDLSDNLLADISPLAGLPGLVFLDLEHNLIASLEPLALLQQLESLVLSHNEISDVSPLLEISSLQSLDLVGNPLSPASIDLHIPSLQERGVQVYFDHPGEPAGPAPSLGTGWESIGPVDEPHELEVWDVVYDPRDPSVVFCTAHESGMWRSHDGGREWERTSRMGRWGAPVAIGPDGVIYTAGGCSHDGGDTWVSCGAVVAADLVRAGRVYTTEDDSRPGGEEVRLLRVSDDHGQTWRDTEAILNSTETKGGWGKPIIWIHPAGPEVIYAGGVVRNDQFYYVVQTLYFSVDGGDTWTVRETDLAIQALVGDPRHRDHLYALDRNAVWHSTDGGRTWESRGRVPSTKLNRLAVHPQDGQRVFAWERGRYAWHSVDGGRHWEALDSRTNSVVPHPGDPEHWLMVSADGALLRTTDGGASWLPTGPREETVFPWGLDVTADGDVCVGAGRRHSSYLYDPLLYRSRNHGAAWTREEPLVPPDISRPFGWLHANPHQANLFLAYGWYPVGLVRSEDGGSTWEQVLLEEGGEAFRVYESTQLPPQISASGSAGDVYYTIDPRPQVLYRSDDWGREWQRRADGLTIFAVHPVDPDLLVAHSEARGVVASEDGGITWEEQGRGPNSGQATITRMALSPGPPMRLYAVAGDGFHVSVDGGATWTRLRRLSDTRVHRIILDPSDRDHIVLVSPTELLETPDQGATWESLVLDPTDPSLLYAATPWGVYRRHSPDSGTAVAIGSDQLPTAVHLSQNYPNPFNARTTLHYTLAQRARVSLVVYDVLGQPVRRLVSGTLNAGRHSVWWGGTDEAGRGVAAGVYLYELQVGSWRRVRRMALIR